MESTHPHSQLENAAASAPLRLCARLSGWKWRGQVGKADTISGRLVQSILGKEEGLRILSLDPDPGLCLNLINFRSFDSTNKRTRGI